VSCAVVRCIRGCVCLWSNLSPLWKKGARRNDWWKLDIGVFGLFFAAANRGHAVLLYQDIHTIGFPLSPLQNCVIPLQSIAVRSMRFSLSEPQLFITPRKGFQQHGYRYMHQWKWPSPNANHHHPVSTFAYTAPFKNTYVPTLLYYHA